MGNMAEGQDNIKIFRPDEFLRKICEGAGKYYKGHGRIVCEIKDGRIEINEREINIETDDAAIAAPLAKIKYCNVFSGPTKKYGHCQFQRSGGILIQVDPNEKELVVLATRGPLAAQIAVDGEDEQIPIKL